MQETPAETVQRLKTERNAIILVHNYQPPEIQDIADLCGDSLELSIQASKTEAAVIVFCGVQFMAESASILCPDKTVLLPDKSAGCPMADMVTPQQLSARIKESPDMPVVTYVNSTAAVKAMSTICCTSANSVKVANSLSSQEILMVPDRNLARYTATKTDKTIYAWDGYCPYHDRLTPEEVTRRRQEYPDALFMAHPECRREVLEMADAVASTSGMLKYAKASRAETLIVGTEIGLLYPLQKASPEKQFVAASESLLCTDMKKIRLDDVATSLEKLTGEVKVPEHIREPAMQAVQKMIEL
ncbi:MAG: quinolinate synthase NadA [Desulfobacterales bacterium]|nr:quinolinate synthase NadA [Desulfobacterales bacterium]